MKTRRRLTALALALGVLMLGSSSAEAFLDPNGPAKVGLLVRIAERLYQAYQWLHHINEQVRSIRNTIDMAFPNEVLNEIHSVFRQARAIQDEIEGLSCNWRFSVRVEGLRLGLTRPQFSLCKPQFQAVYGAPLIGVDQDLAEYRQRQGVIRLNQVRDTILSSREAVAAAAALAKEARAAGSITDPNNPHSVGYSMRLSALAQAQGLQNDTRINALLAMQLDGLQEDLDEQRREDWLQKNAGLTALDWQQDYGKELGHGSLSRGR